ncbi:MAG: SpoIIE family protein phosphatase [Gammaproteobacteria bacterium]|nr:SpoIIE family protein phosphatase [Gammaproteobacteria bacterium]
MFVTLQLAILDRLTGNVQLTSAGYSPALIRRQSGSTERMLDRHGPPLGIEPVDYDYTELHLEPMESILFYSDGVTEARNDQREQFSESRIIGSIEGKQSETAKEMIGSTIYALERFAEEQPQLDDIALVALEFHGGKLEARQGERFEMSLTAAELINAPVGHHVHRFLRPVGLSDAADRDVRLLLDEVLTNSIQHGLKGSTRPLIHVELHVTGENCEITLRDNGIEFDPTRAPHVDIEAGLEERDVGGLGVHICRHVADEVSYRRAHGENIVKLTKTLCLTGSAFAGIGTHQRRLLLISAIIPPWALKPPGRDAAAPDMLKPV